MIITNASIKEINTTFRLLSERFTSAVRFDGVSDECLRDVIGRIAERMSTLDSSLVADTTARDNLEMAPLDTILAMSPELTHSMQADYGYYMALASIICEDPLDSAVEAPNASPELRSYIDSERNKDFELFLRSALTYNGLDDGNRMLMGIAETFAVFADDKALIDSLVSVNLPSISGSIYTYSNGGARLSEILNKVSDILGGADYHKDVIVRIPIMAAWLPIMRANQKPVENALIAATTRLTPVVEDILRNKYNVNDDISLVEDVNGVLNTLYQFVMLDVTLETWSSIGANNGFMDNTLYKSELELQEARRARAEATRRFQEEYDRQVALNAKSSDVAKANDGKGKN